MAILGRKKDTPMINIAPPGREWQVATLKEREKVAENVKRLVFTVEKWIRPQAGQHYDIRLTAPNGQQAERSYSLANAPKSEGILEFGIELLPNGEVSSYLWALPIGGQVEVRGPIGGHFVFNTNMPGPLVLIAGGSGMVPLMSMLRHHAVNFNSDKNRGIVFIISARTLPHVLYQEELLSLSQEDPKLKVIITLTDVAPSDWLGYKKRIDQEIFEKELSFLKETMPLIYVCGPTGFVEAATRLLLSTGFNPHAIKTERFGGS